MHLASFVMDKVHFLKLLDTILSFLSLSFLGLTAIQMASNIEGSSPYWFSESFNAIGDSCLNAVLSSQALLIRKNTI